jgi:hypothetical protein
MKRTISTLNENNNNDNNNSKNNNSEINIKKPKNENLYKSCNLKQYNNAMISSKDLKTQIDNNTFDNNMDDLQISFSKFCEENNSIKIMMGDTRQKKEYECKIINGNYCFFFYGKLEYIKNFF